MIIISFCWFNIFGISLQPREMFLKAEGGISLVFQFLGLGTFTVLVPGSIPG